MRRGFVLLALPLALAACGGGGGSPTAQRSVLKIVSAKYVRRAAQKTAAAPSEHMTLTGTGSKHGQTITMSGSGDAENGQQLLEMHVDAAADGHSIHLDVIGTGQTIYMSSPQFAGQIPGGKKWFKLDLGKAYAAAGLPSTLTQRPSQTLSVFKHAVHAVNLGVESVGGVPTTHYRVRIDYSKILPKKFQKLTHASQETDDAWVGKSDGYVHRLQINKGPLTMTMDFSDFGEAAHVTIPPASETFDATNMALGKLGG
jgi:hypothetical protein